MIPSLGTDLDVTSAARVSSGIIFDYEAIDRSGSTIAGIEARDWIIRGYTALYANAATFSATILYTTLRFIIRFCHYPSLYNGRLLHVER
jgi:hypothetical protein